MTLRFTILIVIFTLVATASGQDHAANKDKEALQGDWRVLAATDNGDKVPAGDIKEMKIKFAGNTVVVHEGDKLHERFMFKLDPAKKPKAIDFLVTEGKKKGSTDLGIYLLDGDSLKLSIKEGGPRPKDFASAAGSKIFYVELRRIKK